jgi:hypothetical protein
MKLALVEPSRVGRVSHDWPHKGKLSALRLRRNPPYRSVGKVKIVSVYIRSSPKHLIPIFKKNHIYIWARRKFYPSFCCWHLIYSCL